MKYCQFNQSDSEQKQCHPSSDYFLVLTSISQDGMLTVLHVKPSQRPISQYENMPMQYTEIFKVVKNENFQ